MEIIIIITHGNMSGELLNSAEMIVGKQNDVFTVSLLPGDTLEKLKSTIGVILEKNIGKNVLILTDIPGGTTSNAAALNLSEHEFELISGVNLGMLLEVLLKRGSCDTKQLSDLAIKAGRESIVNISQNIGARK